VRSPANRLLRSLPKGQGGLGESVPEPRTTVRQAVDASPYVARTRQRQDRGGPAADIDDVVPRRAFTAGVGWTVIGVLSYCWFESRAPVCCGLLLVRPDKMGAT